MVLSPSHLKACFFSSEKTTLFWVGPAVIRLDNRIYANIRVEPAICLQPFLKTNGLMPKVWLHSHGGYIPICYKERRRHQFLKNAMLFEHFLVVTFIGQPFSMVTAIPWVFEQVNHGYVGLPPWVSDHEAKARRLVRRWAAMVRTGSPRRQVAQGIGHGGQVCHMFVF